MKDNKANIWISPFDAYFNMTEDEKVIVTRFIYEFDEYLNGLKNSVANLHSDKILTEMTYKECLGLIENSTDMLIKSFEGALHGCKVWKEFLLDRASDYESEG